MLIHSIPGKMSATWRADVKAVVDTWQSYTCSLADFRTAVLDKGLAHAKRSGGVAWIVDSSKAKGVFTQEIQSFIGSDVFPAFARAGIKHFITILPESAITRLTVKRFQQQTGPHGLQLVEVASLEDAVSFLKRPGAAAA